jgi:hypothetical protein
MCQGYPASGMAQLKDLREWIAKEAARSLKRDDLLNLQLEAVRRQQAEQIAVFRRYYSDQAMGLVSNGSRRPIRKIECKYMSRSDDLPPLVATHCGPVEQVTKEVWRFAGARSALSELANLAAGSTAGFKFPELQESPDQIVVVWFTDDAGSRWQLDQDGHLVPAGDGTEYLS